jgi:hypothetical protein
MHTLKMFRGNTTNQNNPQDLVHGRYKFRECVNKRMLKGMEETCYLLDVHVEKMMWRDVNAEGSSLSGHPGE